MAGNSMILSIGIKQIISNFSPAYLAIIIFLALTDEFQNIIDLSGIILFSTIIAIDLSAIQPYLLQRMLRLNNFLKTYMGKAVNNVMKDAEEENIPRITKILSNAYLKRFRLSIDNFFDEKERKTGIDKQNFEIKEAGIWTEKKN